MTNNFNIHSVDGKRFQSATEMHLLARRLDRQLANISPKSLSPIRASLYLIIRDWAIENRVLYSPFNIVHPFVGDSEAEENRIENKGFILSEMLGSYCRQINSIFRAGQLEGLYSTLPFHSLFEYSLRGEHCICLCRQARQSSLPSHMRQFLDDNQIIISDSRHFTLHEVKESDLSAGLASSILQNLVNYMDMHMHLPEIRMVLVETSSYVFLPEVGRLYIPLLLAGFVQAIAVSAGQRVSFALDCGSDPSSIGVMVAALHSRSNVTEIVHGSFLDHTSVVGKRLEKAFLLPTTYLSSEDVSTSIVRQRSHFAGVAKRWVYLNSASDTSKGGALSGLRRKGFSIEDLPSSSRILIVDATAGEKDHNELSELEEDLTRVLGMLLNKSFTISVKAHPRMGLGSPMSNAISKYPTAKISQVDHTCSLTEIIHKFSAAILNYETNSWKELVTSRVPILVLSTKSLVNLELMRLGIADLLRF